MSDGHIVCIFCKSGKDIDKIYYSMEYNDFFHMDCLKRELSKRKPSKEAKMIEYEYKEYFDEEKGLI